VTAAKVTVVLLILGLPLLGAILARRVPADLFQFPPRLNIPADYLQFSWAAAAAVMAVILATSLPWCVRRHPLSLARGPSAPTSSRATRFPYWGILSLVWTVAWWVLAWTRWPWFEAGQRYTFFPLWLGLIVTANALTHARSGSCLMRRAPGRWLALFGASAACWWSFEWLNRFVRNWHYLNAGDFGAVGYALHATLCFSTVLPAVAAVAEWLQAHARWQHRVQHGPRVPWIGGPRAPLVLAGLGAAGLLGAGALPDSFYPALWLAPLALLLAVPGAGGSRLANELAAGDWRRAATWMIAALICGGFWELWNWHSLAKWIYTVPGIDRWHVFEMPVLGYAGYLPFGLECLLITQWVIGPACQPSQSTT
jgi:hypothetical protein